MNRSLTSNQLTLLLQSLIWNQHSLAKLKIFVSYHFQLVECRKSKYDSNYLQMRLYLLCNNSMMLERSRIGFVRLEVAQFRNQCLFSFFCYLLQWFGKLTPCNVAKSIPSITQITKNLKQPLLIFDIEIKHS